MEWYVAKTGFDMFDALHAYGLCVLLTTVSGMPITLRDKGMMYSLSTDWKFFLWPSLDVFDALFTLPSVEELLPSFSLESVSVPIALFDGLLTVLFTRRARYLSVSDLLRKQRFDTQAVQKGLEKVRQAVKQWKEYVQREASGRPDWFTYLLQDYRPASPALPIPQEGRARNGLTALLTLDPAFAYSTRRPSSDGSPHRKANIGLSGARYATLLAYIGASRFLRAQRVAGKLVNLYVPLASEMTIDESTALLPLFSRDCSAREALVHHFLSSLNARFTAREKMRKWRCEAYSVYGHWETTHQSSESVWKALAYQVLQTQGGQQSTPYDHGFLEYAWIADLGRQKNTSITGFWRLWLDRRGEKSIEEQERLVESLLGRQDKAWQDHFCDVARHAYAEENRGIRLYSVEEVQSMTTTASTPLHTILEREEGTLRVGRALRQLGQYNPSVLRDIIADLETVQTLEQFLRVLYRALHECILAKAKYPYIRIPSNTDVAILMSDVELYGVHLLASILMIVSTLRFSRQEVDKYDVSSLISVLLALITQLPSTGEELSHSSDENASALPTISLFSLDEEGEISV